MAVSRFVMGKFLIRQSPVGLLKEVYDTVIEAFSGNLRGKEPFKLTFYPSLTFSVLSNIFQPLMCRQLQ